MWIRCMRRKKVFCRAKSDFFWTTVVSVHFCCWFECELWHINQYSSPRFTGELSEREKTEGKTSLFSIKFTNTFYLSCDCVLTLVYEKIYVIRNGVIHILITFIFSVFIFINKTFRVEFHGVQSYPTKQTQRNVHYDVDISLVVCIRDRLQWMIVWDRILYLHQKNDILTSSHQDKSQFQPTHTHTQLANEQKIREDFIWNEILSVQSTHTHA